MELLDIVDKQGIPTGKTIEREIAHAQGIWHRTSHVWIVRRREGQLEVLLQQRSFEKDSHPGCFDISSAGHIPAGVDFLPSAVRELEEELGVHIEASALIFCGKRLVSFDSQFHGKPFHDRQVSNVYLLWCDQEESEFVLQKSEVASVRWMPLDDCLRGVIENSFPNCIALEELNMLQRKLAD
jgi:isopentenyldiphosphate isomerase